MLSIDSGTTCLPSCLNKSTRIFEDIINFLQLCNNDFIYFLVDRCIVHSELQYLFEFSSNGHLFIYRKLDPVFMRDLYYFVLRAKRVIALIVAIKIISRME